MSLFMPDDGHRDGETYAAEFDYARLNRQAKLVFNVMADGQWWTLAEIASRTGQPEASVSARIRDFRKHRFGRLTVQRRRSEYLTGLWYYRIILPDHATALRVAPE